MAASSSSSPAAARTTHALGKEHELRLEVGADGEAGFVQLLRGTAELFGVELAEGRAYALPPGRSAALFSWHGCELAVWGGAQNVYTADDGAAPLWAALHPRLEARREEARLGGGWGPRVAVVGPTDAGKSSLCRVLAAYAARCGRAVTVVDTDVGQVRALAAAAAAAAAQSSAVRTRAAPSFIIIIDLI